MANKKQVDKEVVYNKVCPQPLCFHGVTDHPDDGPCKVQDCLCKGGWGFVIKKEKVNE